MLKNKNGKQIRVLSLFDGISIAQQALKELGYEVEYYASEIDENSIKITQKNFPNTIQLGDVVDLTNEKEPTVMYSLKNSVDLIVGGVPCQSWSIAGNRKGFEDDRGNMWWEFIRLLEEIKPKYFLAENVLGLLSHNKGSSFEKICGGMCEAGYEIDFEIINASLVSAQQRSRIFIFGKKLS